ncbi:hypothetical protein J8Z83_05235 [Yersinia enterocolitica]|uniref:hypothetical protein n=1 Tax=Yersinia enterocolitica TaxID=630 RepID=UPI001C8D9EB3|nr:hypothetical protein [Yersinia enterocolitica]MBX9474108.1 hypothetical protein [Yersinia enterocolitica]
MAKITAWFTGLSWWQPAAVSEGMPACHQLMARIYWKQSMPSAGCMGLNLFTIKY